MIKQTRVLQCNCKLDSDLEKGKRVSKENSVSPKAIDNRTRIQKNLKQLDLWLEVDQ